jgi:DHA2 family multidrug resistance protein
VTTQVLPSPALTYSPALDRAVKVMIVAVVTLVTCMEFITSYAIGVALPDIQGDLGASFDEASWIITTYTTCFLVGLLLSNWLSDRIGYRRYMLGAVCMFMFSAMGCGLSHTLAQMLIYRAFMGFAGGNFLVRGQTAIYRIFEGPARLKALTIFGICVVCIARLWGSAVGGYLTEWYSWRYIFFINVPLSLAAIVILTAFAPDLKSLKPRTSLDWIGLILLVAWLAPLQIVLSRGERDDWFSDPLIVFLSILALASFPLFVYWERRPANHDPIISLRPYRSRNFAVGSLYVVVLGMMLYGQLYFVPQFLRNVQHHSAWGTGLLQTLNATAFAIGLVMGAMLMKRMGFRLALAFGATLFMIGMWQWTTRLRPDISDQAMYPPLILTGFGAGWQIGPVSTLINSQISNPFLGEAMELYLCQRQLGGSWNIAILTILVDWRRSFWSGRLAERLNEFNPLAQEALHRGTTALQSVGYSHAQATAGAIGILHGELLIQSIVNAFADTFAYQAVLGIVALGLLLLFGKARSLVSGFQWIVNMVR